MRFRRERMRGTREDGEEEGTEYIRRTHDSLERYLLE